MALLRKARLLRLMIPFRSRAEEEVSELGSRLLEELDKENPKVSRIRGLCRNNPGLIAHSGLRGRIWSYLLLGKFLESEDSSDEKDNSTNSCQEQHVLDSDVSRTRAEIEEFRSLSWRKMISNVLRSYCLKHDLKYKQGMNEVLAPFVYLHPPPKSRSISFTVFEAFLSRHLDRYFNVNDSAYLFKSFRLYNILLMYFDPQLAIFLQEAGFIPEFYCTQWFLTLYSRSLPLPQVLRLWDMLIAMDDPALNFFIGLCLLLRLRTSILSSDSSSIAEVFREISFRSEDDIDILVSEAVSLYNETPRCFLSCLRLCFVPRIDASVGITPQQPNKMSNVESQGILECNDKNMSVQTARVCVMMSPGELVSSLLPTQSPRVEEDEEATTSSLLESSDQQYVVIDLRSCEECEDKGGGNIARGFQLEPTCLDNPERFQTWLKEFEGMRGYNICIVDTPPSRYAVESLAKLLIAEGQKPLRSPILDTESKYANEEIMATKQDSVRPAGKLAVALQRASFPRVCILDGGFPALIEELLLTEGSLDAVVVNHNKNLWVNYLHSTGLMNDLRARSFEQRSFGTNGSAQTTLPSLAMVKRFLPRSEHPFIQWVFPEEDSNLNHQHEHVRNKELTSEIQATRKKLTSELSDQELTQIAYKTALEMNHTVMARLLMDRLSSLATASVTSAPGVEDTEEKW